MSNASTIPTASEELYQAATTGVVRYDASACGRLRMRGRDRAELLHRLSTNDLHALTPGMGTRTVLTNHHGRIRDLLTVYSLPEHLLVVSSPGQGGALADHLRKNIFFQDKVELEELSDSTVQWHFYGPQAAELLAELTKLAPDEWALHHVQAVQIKGKQAWLARTLPLPLDGAGFMLVAEREDWEAMAPAFKTAPELDEATYEVLRIEAGYAAWNHEISLEYIPLETRLADAVSFTKGCYVGQEIIARMDSRQRLAKQLMVLRLAAPVVPPAKLWVDGKEQGDLTSVAQSPRLGVIGLGYVRTAHAKPGTHVTVGDDIEAEVLELPAAG